MKTNTLYHGHSEAVKKDATHKHTPAPWGYSYTSAEDAKDTENGTDGGGATGSIWHKNGKHIFGTETSDTIAFLPHHRDTKEDKEREANARLLASAPELLEALKSVLDHAHNLPASVCVPAGIVLNKAQGII